MWEVIREAERAEDGRDHQSHEGREQTGDGYG